MNKSQGSKNTKHVECINPNLMKYRIRWDFVDIPDTEERHDMVEFWEEEYQGVISLDVVKAVVLHGENELTDIRIHEGFVWKDMHIYMTSENQFNYKAVYDLAVQTNGATLPVVFKFGTDANPIYYTFSELSDFSNFYMSAMRFVQTVLAEGWEKKDSIDWEPYEEDLEELVFNESSL